MTERLLDILRARANHRGLALAEQRQLLDALRCEPAELAVSLEGLVGRGAIEVLSPLPFLVVKVRSWSGDDRDSAKVCPAPYSYGFHNHSLSKQGIESESNRATERRALLAEILDTLGEEYPALFERLLDHYDPQTIRRALTRVRKAQTIQKSRTALFRYLLPRIAKEQITKR